MMAQHINIIIAEFSTGCLFSKRMDHGDTFFRLHYQCKRRANSNRLSYYHNVLFKSIELSPSSIHWVNMCLKSVTVSLS